MPWWLAAAAGCATCPVERLLMFDRAREGPATQLSRQRGGWYWVRSECSPPIQELAAGAQHPSHPPSENWPHQVRFSFHLPALAAIPLPPMGLDCRARMGPALQGVPEL